MPRTPKMNDEEAALDIALCQFCNEAGDPYEPVYQWDEGVKKAFKELCIAYNEWYKTKM